MLNKVKEKGRLYEMQIVKFVLTLRSFIKKLFHSLSLTRKTYRDAHKIIPAHLYCKDLFAV